MKQFVKALNKGGECFAYLPKKFPGLSNEKFKEGIFDGLEISQLIKNPNFVKSMNELEKQTWNSFISVIRNFLGNINQKTIYN